MQEAREPAQEGTSNPTFAGSSIGRFIPSSQAIAPSKCRPAPQNPPRPQPKMKMLRPPPAEIGDICYSCHDPAQFVWRKRTWCTVCVATYAAWICSIKVKDSGENP